MSYTEAPFLDPALPIVPNKSLSLTFRFRISATHSANAISSTPSQLLSDFSIPLANMHSYVDFSERISNVGSHPSSRGPISSLPSFFFVGEYKCISCLDASPL